MEHREASPDLNPTIHFWTVAPTFPLCRQFWRDVLGRMPPGWNPKINKQMFTIECFDGQLLWEFKSADNPEALVAVGLDLVCVCEGALVADEAWEAYLRPRLMTPGRLGYAIINGTPKGKGTWYETAYIQGQDPEFEDWWSINEPSSANPYIEPEELISAAKEMPDMWRRQELNAEFLSGEGIVFRKIKENIIPDDRPDGEWMRPIYIGVDWGRKEDFTVYTAMDATWRVLAQDRMTEISWAHQRGRLSNFASRFRPDGIVVEANAMGDPLIENLQDELTFPIIPWYMTSQNKKRLIESFALSVERGKVTYPNLPVFINEMEAFEMSISESGNIKYAAAGRYHDDTIISCALAYIGHFGAKLDDEVLKPNWVRHHRDIFVTSGDLEVEGTFEISDGEGF